MTNLFNDFYPTPEHLARRMFNKIERMPEAIQYVLEPSAGKGDLLDAFATWYRSKCHRNFSHNTKITERVNIDTVEIDHTLAATLHGKGFNPVWDDFLTYEPSRYYDLIIANFPFSNGAEHLLHAIRIQERTGGEIICLVNAETVRNQCYNNRKELNQILMEYDADIEFIQDAFMDAERKTAVEVALIHMKIPMKNSHSMFEKEFLQDFPDMSMEECTAIARSKGKVESLLFEYEMLRKSGVHLFQEMMRTSRLMMDVGLKLNLGIRELGISKDECININQYIEKLNYSYWCKLVDETDLVNKLPSDLKHTFNSNMQHRKHITFNADNIAYFINELMMAIPDSYEKSVAEVFDKVTRKHHYSESAWNTTIHYYNGWKSNSAYKVNKKVILPIGGNYWFRDIPEVLHDLNLVFENITGEKDPLFSRAYREDRLRNQVTSFDKGIETKFFILDSYKKGTLHVKFKDQNLLDKFNILASKGKKWLPPSFGKKPFSQMDPEEKEAIISFGLSPDEYDIKHLGQSASLQLIA